MGDTCMSVMTKPKGVTAFRSILMQLEYLTGEEPSSCSKLVETSVEAEVKTGYRPCRRKRIRRK